MESKSKDKEEEQGGGGGGEAARDREVNKEEGTEEKGKKNGGLDSRTKRSGKHFKIAHSPRGLLC